MSDDLADPVPFRTTVNRSSGSPVVAVFGEIDMVSAPAFVEAVRAERQSGHVVVDLGEVSFMDSAGAHALDHLLRQSEEEGWELTVAPRFRPTVKRLLELIGMMDVLPMEAQKGSRRR